MFTAEQALQLPPDLQAKYFDDVREFYTHYGIACEAFRKEGITANAEVGVGSNKYKVRVWQQVAEMLNHFTVNGIVFDFEFTAPVPISPVLYSINGHVYALYKSARIHVYSGSGILMPDNGKYFDDKKIGVAQRLIWKNFFLHVSGIADGEKDPDVYPPEEINQDDMPLSKENATDEANRVVRELVEKGLYPTEEDVKAQIKSYNLDKTTIRTINYYRQLQSRLEKDAKKNG